MPEKKRRWPKPWVPLVMLLVISWRMYSNNMVQHYRERTSGLCDGQALGLSDLASLLYDPFLQLRFPGSYPSGTTPSAAIPVRSDGSPYPDGSVHPNQVFVIPLTPGPAPDQVPPSVQFNPCRGREFVANVVDRLKQYGPAVIAIDRYYPAEGCSDSKVNEHFLRSLSTYPACPTMAATCCANAKHAIEPTAIVVGMNSDVTPAANDAASGSAPVNCLVETEELPFIAPPPLGGTASTKPHTVHTGLLRLNSDPLEIPLEWWLAPADRHSGKRGRAVSGFAFAVYKQAVVPLTPEQRAQEDPSVSDDQLTHTKLAEMIKSYDHPFARLPKKSPTHIAPENLFCADDAGTQVLANFLQEESALSGSHVPSPGEKPKMCSGKQPLPALLGNIVLIGLDAPEQDRHPLLHDEVLGVDLQAEYVEALLSQSYVMAAPWWLDWGMVGVLFLEVFISEFRFDRSKISFRRSFFYDAASLLLLVIVAIVLLRFSLLVPNFLGVAGAVFITGLVTRALERAKEVRKEERERVA